MKLERLIFVVSLLVLLLVAGRIEAQAIYEVPDGVETRWYSFENPDGAKGAAAITQRGRKGAANKVIDKDETVTMADIEGPGVIRRIWLTVRPERPELLRGLVIRIYWDRQKTPSVEAPLQDFFGIPFARQVRFESAFLSNPEGRSFNCSFEMPFQKHARVTIENQTGENADMLFYDIDVTIGDKLPDDLCYFHARYSRENPTTPKKDFEILPKVTGRGRFLGCNIGVRQVEPFLKVWFGEGEVKAYIDGDKEFPTLAGTGTEDYIGTAWGQGTFDHLYQGCLLANNPWAFYRFHVKDPIYFHSDIRVTIQQISGTNRKILGEIGEEHYPELVATGETYDPGKDTEDWNNFEVIQDVCATAYWYQTLPSPDFGPLEPFEERMKDLLLPPEKGN